MNLKEYNPELFNYLSKLLKSDIDTFLNAPFEPKAIYLNTLKTTDTKFKQKLHRLNIFYRDIDFSANGIIIEQEDIPLSHTLAYFEGEFNFQGISSQIPAIVLDVKPGEKVLDMCAAPGMKSIQLASAMQGRGELVLNDASRSRLQPLNANMQRSGAANFYILNMPGQKLGKYFPHYFDKILLDAPCTALGMLSENVEVANWWSNEKLKKLCHIQFHLLVSAIKALKVGGELVYSTCSVAPEENEMLINKILQNYPVEILPLPENLKNRFSPGMINVGNSEENCLRVWPHLHGMEGFFIAKLRKTEKTKQSKLVTGNKFFETFSFANLAVEGELQNISEMWGIPFAVWQKFRFIPTKTKIWMVGSEIENYLNINFVSGGILLAEKRLFGWKLVNGSVQFLSHRITKRIAELKEDDLKSLFLFSQLNNVFIEDGYFALSYKKQPIASVYMEKNQMKIRLPHKFNLVI